MLKKTFIIASVAVMSFAGKPAEYINPFPAFDFDRDCDVDQDDFGILQRCMSDIASDPGCHRADRNRNGVIDTFDVKVFEITSKGPGIRVDRRAEQCLYSGVAHDLSGRVVPGAVLEFVGNERFKGYDFSYQADENGEYHAEIPLGWTGTIITRTPVTEGDMKWIVERIYAHKKSRKTTTKPTSEIRSKISADGVN